MMHCDNQRGFRFVALLCVVGCGAACSTQKFPPAATEITSAKALIARGHLSNWQESRDPKTGKKQTAFFLASENLAPYLEADATRNAATLSRLQRVAWAYGFLLVGEMQIYRAEQIQAFRVDGHERAIFSSGEITIDKAAATIDVSLRVQTGGKTEEFVGNGTYALPLSR